MSPEAIEGLVADYGYGIVLVGTYFDHYGIPLFLVFGGIAASKDVLNVYGVLLCGFAGGWIADLFLYFLGHKTGLAYWMQFAWVRKMETALTTTHRMFQTRPALVVILGRFLFAVSKIIPPFAGMIHYDVRRYVLYSFVGNVLFSLAYTGASFYAGPFLLAALEDLEWSNVALTLGFVIALYWIAQRALDPSRRS
ncbi:DedA family protein [Nitrospina watsonii]|uniref:SNARE associated Golgi protein-related protein n=1 Tax=Nitrospina watsonii TaxID=1323948 RepID=A0ABN8VVU0_9BACT|nr:VTT domain-containing protein [Nitrospina watsonii]CAI2717895.1 Putative SNARE associated Golgi protein-related protein [Nitrospina watsonii]